jgi:hypothetical protein
MNYKKSIEKPGVCHRVFCLNNFPEEFKCSKEKFVQGRFQRLHSAKNYFNTALFSLRLLLRQQRIFC